MQTQKDQTKKTPTLARILMRWTKTLIAWTPHAGTVPRAILTVEVTREAVDPVEFFDLLSCIVDLKITQEGGKLIDCGYSLDAIFQIWRSGILKTEESCLSYDDLGRLLVLCRRYDGRRIRRTDDVARVEIDELFELVAGLPNALPPIVDRSEKESTDV